MIRASIVPLMSENPWLFMDRKPLAVYSCKLVVLKTVRNTLGGIDCIDNTPNTGVNRRQAYVVNLHYAVRINAGKEVNHNADPCLGIYHVPRFVCAVLTSSSWEEAPFQTSL